MMLIGTGKSRRVAELISNISCPNCKTQGSLLMEGYLEYLILGLPVFPISKWVVVDCTFCKKYFPPSQISNEMYRGVQYIKSKIKPAIWMFSLPLLIGVIFLMKMGSPSESEQEYQTNTVKIEKDDIYTIEASRRKYKKLRVLFVKDDSVVLRESGHEPVKYDWIKKIKSFHGDTITVSKEDLLLKYQHEE